MKGRFVSSRGGRRALGPLAVAVVLLLATTSVAMASGEGEGSNNLSAGAIVGLAFSFGIAGLLLILSLGYILPKPPGR